MAAGCPQHAKRALVKVLLTIAALYSVRLSLTRDAPDEDCIKAFRKVSLKAHPDKGCLLAHSQTLNAAKEVWDKVRHNKQGRGRSSTKKRGTTDVQPQVAEGTCVASFGMPFAELMTISERMCNCKTLVQLVLRNYAGHRSVE